MVQKVAGKCNAFRRTLKNRVRSRIDQPPSRLYLYCMATRPKKSVADILSVMSEEHRRMVAEGMATMHRFAAEPSFRHGKPQYKGGNTVAAVTHAKSKGGR
jgi:hypothetical protein